MKKSNEYTPNNHYNRIVPDSMLRELQIERDRLAVLINNILDEIWFTDECGNIILTNQTTHENFMADYKGANVAEVVASLEIYRTDGSPCPIEETPILRVTRGEEIINAEEIIRLPVNRELRYRNVNAVPVRNREGTITGAVTIIRDITEQKKAEEALETVKMQLTQEVEALSKLHRISTFVLLHNALKFTPENGTVRISLKKEKEKAVIHIQDNGIGMGTGTLSQLFQPFMQADHSLHRSENKGLGLGLSIVKAVIEMHGGKITASSNGLGKGSLFSIYLPITEEGVGTQTHTVSDKTEQLFNILIIEDNRDLAYLTCEVFSILGHRVKVAYDGIEGIKKAREIKPDIILCDIGLPGMNGYEVAAKIREDQDLKDVHLIALSGYAGGSDIAKAKEHGFDKHLGKPIDIAMLNKVLGEFSSL